MSREMMENLLKQAVNAEASDLFIVAGCPCAMKVNGTIQYMDDKMLKPADTAQMVQLLYEMGENPYYERFLENGDNDFSFSVAGIGRFRVNTYLQRNSQAAALRVVSFDLPDPQKLHIPEIITDMYAIKKGLILVTGSAGSGKSTTLSCIIERINKERSTHIVTIEDPIEFLHRHKKSIVSQREIDHDTTDYISALRSALRQAPEVILLGEMRDLETIETAVTAAETGHLILSTVHTIGAANTIDRILDVFPPNQQQQIRIQLSMVLHAVISQQLVPCVDGTLIPAFEIMIANQAIRSQIREAKTHQIDNTIYSNRASGMITMDESLILLLQEGKISKATAITYSTNPDAMQRRIALLPQ